MADMQILYNPRTKEVRYVDISQGTAEVARLYQSGWQDYTQAAPSTVKDVTYQPPAPPPPPSPQSTATITETPVTTTTVKAPASTPSGLQSFVKDGRVNLVEVYKSGNQQAIKEAEQAFGKEANRYAYWAAKAPVTGESYTKLGEGTKPKTRVVRAVSLEEYKKMSDFDKLFAYPKPKAVSAAVYAALGPGTKEKGTVYPELKWHEKLTSVKEEEGEKVTAKSFAIQLGEAVVPFVYTARHWDEMQDWEKGVHLFADAVFLATMAGTGKSLVSSAKAKLSKPEKQAITAVAERTGLGQPIPMSPSRQAKAEYETVNKLAKEATAARNELRLRLQAIDAAERMRIMPRDMPLPANQVQRGLMENLQRAAQRSQVADKKFAEAFTNLNKLTPKQLQALEKTSGFKGIAEVVKDIGKTEKNLAAAWKEFQSSRIPRGEPGWWSQLRKVEDLHANLAIKYERYNDIINPARTRTLTSEAPRGVGSWIRRRWGKLKGTDIYVDVSNEEQIGKQLYELKKLARRGTLPADGQKALYDEIAQLEKWRKAYQEMKPDDIDELFRQAAAEAKGAKPSAPSGESVDTQLRMKLREVVEKEKGPQSERFWEMPKKKAATATEEKATEDLEKIWKTQEKAAKAAPKAEQKRAPKVEEEKPKFGMKPKPKAKVREERIPSEVMGRRTYAAIARDYGERAVEDAVGIPLRDLDTAKSIRTAIQINEEFQTQLAGATRAAANTLVNTYSRTRNINQASTDAMNAVETYLNAQPQPQTQPQTLTQIAVQTQVKQAVRDMIYRLRPRLTRVMPIRQPDDGGLKIKEVKGIPEDPGVITWRNGIVKVRIEPPYRTGDISYARIKPIEEGKGSQEETLKVTEGEAPDKLVLQRGFDLISIRDGKEMSHRRIPRVNMQTPGMILKGGKARRQRRGMVL